VPVESSYSLIPEVAPASPSTASSLDASSFAFAQIVGVGLVVPFQRGPSDFNASGSIEMIESSISQVLGVRARSARTGGELPWRSEFGSKFDLLRHKKAESLITLATARSFAIEAITRWLPEIRLKSVEATVRKSVDGRTKNGILIRVSYDLVGLNRSGISSVLASNEVSVDVL
jgi:phage baseplate assembly protein W